MGRCQRLYRGVKPKKVQAENNVPALLSDAYFMPLS